MHAVTSGGRTVYGNVEERTLQRRVEGAFGDGLQPRWLVFSARPWKTATTAKADRDLDSLTRPLKGRSSTVAQTVNQKERRC